MVLRYVTEKRALAVTPWACSAPVYAPLQLCELGWTCGANVFALASSLGLGETVSHLVHETDGMSCRFGVEQKPDAMGLLDT